MRLLCWPCICVYVSVCVCKGMGGGVSQVCIVQVNAMEGGRDVRRRCAEEMGGRDRFVCVQDESIIIRICSVRVQINERVSTFLSLTKLSACHASIPAVRSCCCNASAHEMDHSRGVTSAGAQGRDTHTHTIRPHTHAANHFHCRQTVHMSIHPSVAPTRVSDGPNRCRTSVTRV